MSFHVLDCVFAFPLVEKESHSTELPHQRNIKCLQTESILEESFVPINELEFDSLKKGFVSEPTCDLCQEVGIEQVHPSTPSSSSSLELVTLRCNHVICSQCITSIITINSKDSLPSFFVGNTLKCPFRCDGSSISSTSDCSINRGILNNTQRLLLKQKQQLHRTFQAAFFEAKELVESKKTFLFSPSRLEALFQYRLNEILSIDNKKRLDRIGVEIIKETDTILSTRHFNTCCHCSAVWVGGVIGCGDDQDAEVFQGDILDKKKCLKCSHVQYCKIHKSELLEFKCMYCCARRPATYICGDDIHLCSVCHEDKLIKQICEASSGNCVFDGKHPKNFPVGKAHKKYSTGCVGCR